MRLRFVSSILLILTLFFGTGTIQRLFAADNDSGQIVVSATIPPKPTSILLGITATGNNDTVPQSTDIVYTISYGSTNDSNVPLSFEASWGQGIVQGASEPTIDVMKFVVGSAEKAYGNTAPIIDERNRTIRWEIPTFPANLQNQKVSFTLKTSDSYTGQQIVSIPVTLRATSPTGVPEKSVIRNYRYSAPAEVEQEIPTPTPEPILDTRVISDIKLQALGSVSAKIGVQTTRQVTTRIVYGILPGNLSIALPTDAISETRQSAVITGLKPGTTYFYRVDALENGAVIQSSEVFTFKTSSSEPITEASATNITVTQQRAVIFSSEVNVDALITSSPVVVTNNTVVDLSITIPESNNIREVIVVVRNPSVLGAMSNEVDSDKFSSNKTKMTRFGQSTFVGKLRTPNTPGDYEVVSQVEDVYGNFTEQPLGKMNIVAPFSVRDNTTKLPLSHAKVLLSFYNSSTTLYEVVSNVGMVKNPTFSDENGVVNLQLVTGKYRAEISLPGYKTSMVDFSAGTKNDVLPQVELMRNPTIFGGRIEYYTGMFIHFSNKLTEYSTELARSKTFVELVFIQIHIFIVGLASLILLMLKKKLLNLDWLPDFTHRSYKHRLISWVYFFIYQALRFWIEVCIVFDLFFTAFFTQELGNATTFYLLCIVIIEYSLWYTLIIASKKRATILNYQKIER